MGELLCPNAGSRTIEKISVRKHHHSVVTVTYSDDERFERVYIDRKRAEKFAARQTKSPVVLKARIRRLS